MTSKTSLVSVIIPAYNCAAAIERCAKSIIAQSYKNIEIVIINDGSTDTIDKKIIEHCMETASANNVPVVYGEVDLTKNGNTIEKRKFPHKKSHLRDSGDIFLNCDWLFAWIGVKAKKATYF